MFRISQIRQASNKFRKALNVYMAEAIESQEEGLIEFNIVQLERSLSKEGKAITPEYSPSYAKKKGFEHPDLKDTGDFHSDFFLSVNENKPDYIISSADEKTPKLLERYDRTDQNIFGVPDADQQEARKLTFEPFAKLYRKIVFGK